MRPRPFLLLIASFALALMAAGDADAKEPEWSYTTGNEVESVAISADGEYIAAGSIDHKVYLFGKDSSTPLWNYTAGSYVHSVAISADGEYIAAGSSNNKVYLFDKDSSTPLWSYLTGDYVLSVAISADGEYIAAGSYDGKVYLFDKDSSTPLWSYETGTDVYSVAISADGEYIAAGSDDAKVYLFDKDSSTPLWSYETGNNVAFVSISADGEYIAAGSNDQKIYLFGKNSSTPLWSYETGDYVYSGSISADGKYIAAGSSYQKIYLFGKNSSTPLWSYETGGYVYSVSISADGEYIAAGSSNNKVYLFDKDSSTPLWSSTAGNRVNSVATSADGEYIAAGAGYPDGKVYLFDYDIPPTATIDSITPSLARFDAEVTFSGTGSDSDGTVVAYEWTSNIDGFLSDEEDFSITGFSAGYHTISFRVQDNDEEWSPWSTAELEIYPNTPPEAYIDSIFGGREDSYNPECEYYGPYGEYSLVCTSADAVVSFIGTGYDGDGTIVAYEWNSSIDGILSVERDVAITGLSIGQHTITLRVQDNDGGWSTIYQHYQQPDIQWPFGGEEEPFYQYQNERIIEVVPNLYPEVTINSLSSSAGNWSNSDAYYFDYTGLITVNAATNDFDGSIVLYCWQLNNEVPTCMGDYSDYIISFSDFDEYAISLTVTDNDGDTDSASNSFYYYASPIAYAGDDIVVKPNATVDFNGQGSDADGTIVKYEWDLNADGVYEWSSDDNGALTYTYVDEGIYTPTLRVTDNDGHTTTDSLNRSSVSRASLSTIIC